MEITQEEKAALLERAVINNSAGELAKIYGKFGYVEMSAQALGLACRFRGMEMVETLVQQGASFAFPLTKETEEKYHCYIGQNYDNYRTNYSLYLLKVFRGDMKGACCVKGMTFQKGAKREAGKPLPFLSDDERVRVLDYLFENREKISFQPEEMLFYAIYAKDCVIREELRRLGVKLSGIRVHTIADGARAMDGYWHEYSAMTGKLDNEDYLEIMQQLSMELDGKPFHFTEKIYEIAKKHFRDVRVFEYFLAHFKQDKMSKYQIIRGLIDENALDALPVIEKEGWLGVPGKRDEMIEYASKNGRTEPLAWLLDFKNRTADFAAEQEKAEKKMMRELNRAVTPLSPDSVAALKKIWSYRKRKDGTLMITNYKGTDTEVTVPEKIGKNTVTAIGDNAFVGGTGVDNPIYATWEQMRQHQEIKKITLPETVQYIGAGAFAFMRSLREINIPGGMEEIGAKAFFWCSLLETMTLSRTVEKIGRLAFSLCSKLVVSCPEKSVAEAYCRENGIKTEVKNEHQAG